MPKDGAEAGMNLTESETTVPAVMTVYHLLGGFLTRCMEDISIGGLRSSRFDIIRV